ncbi:MAG: SMI1/KNR4 family protein [Clostridiales Family XIII bacterium]|nr:SMI1/KNR4 family protein [Clostridiales Family XIII bacterium]
MWKEKLNEIVQEKQLYGEKTNNGASKDETKSFNKKVKKELGGFLPKAYMDILEIVNGIEFNGIILYGIDENEMGEVPNQPIHGLLKYNKIWYENEWQRKYIFLGEGNISWYVYDKHRNKYFELDNPSGSESKEFTHFEDMFENLLSDASL